jgi:hypothetical protein
LLTSNSVFDYWTGLKYPNLPKYNEEFEDYKKVILELNTAFPELKFDPETEPITKHTPKIRRLMYDSANRDKFNWDGLFTIFKNGEFDEAREFIKTRRKIF